MNSYFIEHPLSNWGIFFVLIFSLLIFDLGILNKKKDDISIKRSLALSSFYIVVGLSFSLWINLIKGESSAHDYLTGYLIEKSLSLDNIFVISLIFSAFQIPSRYQHRVLFWGILGVLILRGIMIALGSWLIHQFEWITYVFAFFLVVTGMKMIFVQEGNKNIQESKFFKFLSTYLRVTPELHQQRFFVWLKNDKGKRVIWVTPLFLILIMIEAADLVFAVDSVPAIFSITNDSYIVYTSNIFAILGLRSLYFALAKMIDRFIYLKYALALILVFIGGKVLVVWLFSIDKIPSLVSLFVTLFLLLGGMMISLLAKREV